MSGTALMPRQLRVSGLALLAVAALSGPALAHISLATREAPVGSTLKAVLVIGHGCGAEATTAVRVQIPAGFYSVRAMPKPGWELEMVTGPYAQPYSDHGTEVTEGVTEIRWSGGNLPDAQFDEFAFRGTFGSELGAESIVHFPVIQTCGTLEDAWIDTSGDAEAEMPAPAITLVPAPEGHSH